MEEVGRHHMTSPFLTTYIELFERKFGGWKSKIQYASDQELIDRIRQFGGFPIIAHPTNEFDFYQSLDHFGGVEIYSAFSMYYFEIGEYDTDQNEHFVEIWDNLLTHKSTRIFGYAVNDWHGPFNKELRDSHPDIYDSGKTLVMLKDFTLADYRRSLEMGAFFAIKDLGREKGHIPKVSQISVSDSTINITALNGRVEWIFCGDVLHEGASFALDPLPISINYVRAEVRNVHGIVYVQPFSLTPADMAHE
jgi:hypothetical protein